MSEPSTGLDWLDVTQTRNLSYDQVVAQMATGGAYEGWRYAYSTEFDALVTSFGYTAITTGCAYGVIYCDSDFNTDSTVIETMLHILGDNADADDDFRNMIRDTDINGGAASWFILIDDLRQSAEYSLATALIADQEYIYRGSGLPYIDYGDYVISANGPIGSTQFGDYYGSGLVRVSEVPAPATLPLMALGLAALGYSRRKSKQHNLAA